MKLFKNSSQKLHSAYALKHGSIAAAITAAFIVCVILLNVLVTVLTDKYSLSLDSTTDKSNSISEENIEYIKAVDKLVNIYVFASEKDFEDGTFSSYASSEFNISDSTGKYYLQTAHLIKKYSKYNKNLKVEFVDKGSARATELQKSFSDYEILLGDVLVECNFKSNGKAINRQKVLSYYDIYTLTDDSGYASTGYYPYSVSGNNIETALTSALYYVTNEKTVKVGVPVNYCSLDSVDGFISSLENYSYEIVEINGPAITDLDPSLDALLLYDLKADLAAPEISAIEEFLDNGGKKGKALLYFASASSPKLPAIDGMLKKWGIGFKDGLLYETAESNYLENNPLLFGSVNTFSEYTSGVNDDTDFFYISTENQPMEILKAGDDTTVTTLLKTTDTAVIKTSDGKASEPGSFPVALASKQISDSGASHIIAFSSVNFITTSYNNYSDVGNITLIADALNYVVGREATDIDISAKVIDPSYFSSQVNAQSSIIVSLVFVILLPLALIVCGIVFYIKRKNR